MAEHEEVKSKGLAPRVTPATFFSERVFYTIQSQLWELPINVSYIRLTSRSRSQTSLISLWVESKATFKAFDNETLMEEGISKTGLCTFFTIWSDYERDKLSHSEEFITKVDLCRMRIALYLNRLLISNAVNNRFAFYIIFMMSCAFYNYM